MLVGSKFQDGAIFLTDSELPAKPAGNKIPFFVSLYPVRLKKKQEKQNKTKHNNYSHKFNFVNVIKFGKYISIATQWNV